LAVDAWAVVGVVAFLVLVVGASLGIVLFLFKVLEAQYRHNPPPELIADVCTCRYPPSGRIVKAKTALGGEGLPLKKAYRLIDRTCPNCGQWEVYASGVGLPQGYKRWICRRCGHVLTDHEKKERGMLREQIYFV